MRHGEVDNPQGILYGRLPDFHLSELGRKMTQRTAQQLFDEGRKLDLIVSSPLERAIESAQGAAELFGLPITQDPNLLESKNSFEGEAVNGNRKMLLHPRNWARYRNPARPSWCEPYADQAKRMSNAVRKALHTPVSSPQNLLTNADGQQVREILLVSHQLPIWCLRLFIEGRSYAHLPTSRECALASLTSLTFLGNSLISLSYWQPDADLLKQASDMVPGTSAATLNQGA